MVAAGVNPRKSKSTHPPRPYGHGYNLSPLRGSKSTLNPQLSTFLPSVFLTLFLNLSQALGDGLLQLRSDFLVRLEFA